MQREFGRFRTYVWPIHRRELKKIIPMLLMAFLTAMIYEVLRSMKESLIVTAAGSGAEVIPFLKVWAMLPMAILLTWIFVKLSHRFASETVYYLMVGGFLTFFLIFAFVIYPMRESCHLHGLADWMTGVLPRGCGGLIAMVRYWSFSLFYAMAETWGTVCLMILFWGFANEITSVSEAGRFYGIIAIGSNVASIFAGKITYMMALRNFNPNWVIGADAWHQSLILLTVTVVGSGILLLATFRWFNKSIVSKLDLPTGHRNKKLDKLESKRSMLDSLRYLMKSKYVMRIALIVICYNIFINLVEVLWKSKVKLAYPNPNDYTAFMSSVTLATGCIATVMALVVSGNMIRKFGWTRAALFTPVVLVVTSILFFTCYLTPDHVLGGLVGMSPLTLVVIVGGIQNCISRASKYTVFDETKDISLIPLDREARVKGKAAIDGVTSRLGKSGGSLIYQGMLFFFGEISASAPYVAGLLVLVLGFWIGAVRRLGSMFEATEKQLT